MKMKKILKLIALVATLAMIFSMASCDLFKSKLKLESFTVDRSSVKTNYLVGEEIDFSGIQATAKYSDESLNKVYTYNELTITYAEDITATEGDKEVTVSFMDPHLNVKQEAKVAVKVTKEPIVEPELSVMAMFEKPNALKQFEGSNNVNTELQYGQAGFAGQFTVGGKTYVIGNENDFRFNPEAVVMDEAGDFKPLESFFSVVELFVEKNGEYVALTAKAGDGNSVSYYDGETLIATVDTYNGLYNFSADAADLKVKISVLPSAEYYIFDETQKPVVLEAKVIKAYNIYEAWELAVIDNDNTDGREGNADWNDTRVWEAFKAEKGIAKVTVSGIVLHCDLHLTENDIPDAFFQTTTKDIVYKNAETGETKTIPAGTKYLRDWSNIYRRVMAPGETFVMEGNFFSISLANFPLVASPAVFGLEGVADDYGADFSNSDFIRFASTEADDAVIAEENYAKVTLQNINLIGNAARDNWVDADGNLVSAGGLIFLKSNRFATVDFDNIIGNSFFITYFADDRSVMNVANVKCYDSYQNAIYMWGDAKMTVVDSYFVGAGGPMAIVASPELNSVYTSPNLVATNTLFDTHLTGEEIWFAAIGGTTVVGQMKALSDGMKGANLGSFVDDNGKMSLHGLLMPSGENAEEVITGIGAQGSISLNGAGMNRNQGTDNIHWMTIFQISEGAKQLTGQMPPFFTVYDEAGTAYTIFFNGTTFVDLQQKPLGTDASHAAIMAAFQAADKITMTMGGISVVLEFYH